MPIDMRDYKMIVEDKVYNVLQVVVCIDFNNGQEIKVIDAAYLDENGMVQLMRDEASKFQFVKRI